MFGKCKKVVALGLLSSFGCPLSFGPARSVFSPLFSLSLVSLLFANVALFFLFSLSLSLSLFFSPSLSLSFFFSQALGKCKPCLVCISLVFFFRAAVFSLNPYFVLITFKAPFPPVFGFVLYFLGSFGVVVASILALLERFFPENCPMIFSLSGLVFLGAFSLGFVVVAVRVCLVCFVGFFFSLSLSLFLSLSISLLFPSFSAFLERERSC